MFGRATEVSQFNELLVTGQHVKGMRLFDEVSKDPALCGLVLDSIVMSNSNQSDPSLHTPHGLPTTNAARAMLAISGFPAGVPLLRFITLYSFSLRKRGLSAEDVRIKARTLPALPGGPRRGRGDGRLRRRRGPAAIPPRGPSDGRRGATPLGRGVRGPGVPRAHPDPGERDPARGAVPRARGELPSVLEGVPHPRLPIRVPRVPPARPGSRNRTGGGDERAAGEPPVQDAARGTHDPAGPRGGGPARRGPPPRRERVRPLDPRGGGAPDRPP